MNALACRRFLLVHDASFSFLQGHAALDDAQLEQVRFSSFGSNPCYEDVLCGVRLFRESRCDAIVAIGGGSAIDVAKCIKLYGAANEETLRNPFELQVCASAAPLIALPTTAGTGSESTRYAVVYWQGRKQSVCSKEIIPEYVFLDPNFLDTLPEYQKKCTLLDALCQGIESWWSVNSNQESIMYSRCAVTAILANFQDYLAGTPQAAENMLEASNQAGLAINITQTTAAHAMSYKITSLYHLPHGHAVALSLPAVWDYMNRHPHLCVDPRGEAYLKQTFEEIAMAMGCAGVEQAISCFRNILQKMNITPPGTANEADIDLLAGSVNATRLGNNPVALTETALRSLYRQILLNSL